MPNLSIGKYLFYTATQASSIFTSSKRYFGCAKHLLIIIASPTNKLNKPLLPARYSRTLSGNLLTAFFTISFTSILCNINFCWYFTKHPTGYIAKPKLRVICNAFINFKHVPAAAIFFIFS